jgi:hypothetical protein
MDRITHQSPRPRGYGSTSSLRNDSLKHTRKHERRKGGIKPRSKALSLRRTVQPDRADRPAGYRGLSARAADCSARAADRPLKPTEPPVAHREQRTVRGEHADCPPGTRGPSAPCCGPSETPSNRKPKTRRIETKVEQEHEELGMNPTRTDRPPAPRGLSSRCGQSRKRPTPKVNSPKSSSDFPNG